MTRQVILHVSPVLYGRMELRANQQRHDLHEWLLRAVIGELLRLENEDTCRAHEARAIRSSLPKAHSTTERKPHASHS